jgi:transposase
MSTGKRLTAEEKGKVQQLHILGFSQRKIAKEIGRSKTVICHYLADPIGYGLVPRSGRPRAVRPRTMKRIITLASNKVTSAAKIKHRLGLRMTSRTVCRYLKGSENLKFQKMKGRPPLTKEHKEKRLEFALNHVMWNSEWTTVIFSDEKKFNLDGPDGFHYYWHDTRKEELTFSKRVQGGDSVMVWIGFCASGKTSIEFISTRMNSENYISLLDRVLLPFGRSFLGNQYTFQQDNASCHRAIKTTRWLNENNISTFDWPSRSPDLNPVENLWGILSRMVYDNGRQFGKVTDLKKAILEAWNQIPNDILRALVNSMPNRMYQVIKGAGNSINY